MLLDALKEAARREADKAIVEEFRSEITKIMAPFDPGCVRLSMIQDITPWRKLGIHVDHLGDFVFPLQWEFSSEMNRRYILEQIAEIWRELYVEPEDHIQLGLE